MMYRRGQMTPNALVCMEGAEKWVPVRTEIPAIGNLISKPDLMPYSAPVAVKTRSNEFLAALLSFMLVGVGHAYVGEPFRGVVFLLATLLVGLGINPLLSLVVIAVAIMDAMRLAREGT